MTFLHGRSLLAYWFGNGSGLEIGMTVQPKLSTLLNYVRRVETMFPGYFPGNTKHNYRKDFGFPETLTFEHFYHMFSRNGLAEGAVEQTKLETWQDFPTILVDAEAGELTPEEQEIANKFEELRLWQCLAEADARSMVGRYSAVILRVADGMRFDQPLQRMNNGLEALVEVIPAWEGQLRVSLWDDDETSENYGRPRMFEFNEQRVDDHNNQNNRRNRQFNVHPDRVIIWSTDGTVHAKSKIEAGYDSLMTLEKIVGAGGEGFWKNATGRPVLETDKDVRIEELKKALGATTDNELVDKMNEHIDDWNKGFDSVLWLQGMQAKNVDANLASPEHFFNIALQVFCASWPIPAKVLTGSQTGERASTEDNNQWRKINHSRRVNVCKPTIAAFISRLRKFGMLRDIPWHVKWSDLTESTMAEKIARAEKMSNINKNSPDEPVFLPEEIRDVVGLDPIAYNPPTDDDRNIEEPDDEDDDDADDDE